MRPRALPTGSLLRIQVRFDAWRLRKGDEPGAAEPTHGYRARRGSGWRTFGVLSALSAIVIGSSTYYPYAYISAPQPYCDGLTEDGCELMWQEVRTLEGDLAYQCVAYCPWR